jgi:hypothetical protein
VTVGGVRTGEVERLWLAALQRATAGASHDVRDALNGVAVNLEVIRSRSARPDAPAAAAAPFAEAAAQQLERLTSLLEAVLALGRTERTPADVGVTLRRLAAVCSASSASGDAAVAVAQEPAASDESTTQVAGDAVRLALGAPLLEAVAGRPGGGGAGVVRCVIGGTATDVVVTIAGAGHPLTMPAEVVAAVRAAGVRWTDGPEHLSLAFPRA